MRGADFVALCKICRWCKYFRAVQNFRRHKYNNLHRLQIVLNELLFYCGGAKVGNVISFLKEKEAHCLASNKFGEAVSCTLKRWDKLKEFMNCAEMTPDNNLAENAIRPFVLGRKNWLFTGSEEGARSSCLWRNNKNIT